MTQEVLSCPRVVALVGPYSSGKTTLLENILHMTGSSTRRSSPDHPVADQAPEARALGMGVDINMASTVYKNDSYVFIDCPGSIEFACEARHAIHAADMAVVVVEACPDRIIALSPLLHDLERDGIPHMVFVNKVDRSNAHVRDVARALEEVSALPVILRHLPMRENGDVTGFVDLGARRAYKYQAHTASRLIDMPEWIADEAASERYTMMETISEFHDDLMEDLLEDIDPSSEEVFSDLAEDLRSSRIMPVLMGSASNGYGLKRLLKALRHEMPDFQSTLERIGAEPRGEGPSGYVFKTRYLQHMGKLSYVRVISGQMTEGDIVAGQRLTTMLRLTGPELARTSIAAPGEIVVLGRMEALSTGDSVGDTGVLPPEGSSPVYGLAVSIADQKMEARLSDALAKLTEEDPSYQVEHRQESSELVLWGQGEIHLRAAQTRLVEKFGLEIDLLTPKIPYRETIRKPALQHTRFKKQTGGHGQFGDVVIEINPRGAGEGFSFREEIKGGNVPRQYIPSVENGVKDSMSEGPLGYPVVDVAVTLKDGAYHNVDSSDHAFRTAARMAMKEALPDCSPVLLEPVEKVDIMAPSSFTARINSLLCSRRGRILGFGARNGWPGWDKVEAHLPQAEMQDLIVELRSLTLGSGTFTHNFDHLSEVSGAKKSRSMETHH